MEDFDYTEIEDMDEAVVRRLLQVAKNYNKPRSIKVLDQLLWEGQAATEDLQIVIDDIYELVDPHFKKENDYALEGYWHEVNVDLNRFGGSL